MKLVKILILAFVECAFREYLMYQLYCTLPASTRNGVTNNLRRAGFVIGTLKQKLSLFKIRFSDIAFDRIKPGTNILLITLCVPVKFAREIITKLLRFLVLAPTFPLKVLLRKDIRTATLLSVSFSFGILKLFVNEPLVLLLAAPHSASLVKAVLITERRKRGDGNV